MLHKVLNKKIAVFPLVDNCCQMEWLSFQLPRFQNQLGFELFLAEKASEANVFLVAGELSERKKSAVLEAYSRLRPSTSVVAMGFCQISDFSSDGETTKIGDLIPIDYSVEGCPPSPSQLVEVFQEINRKRGGENVFNN